MSQKVTIKDTIESLQIMLKKYGDIPVRVFDPKGLECETGFNMAVIGQESTKTPRYVLIVGDSIGIKGALERLILTE